METAQEKKTILLVEDDVALRRVLLERFTADGFNVLDAADGEIGLAKAKEFHPDLILMDIFMPRMDGVTMLGKLRREDAWGKHVQVIVLTNSADAQTIAMVAGMGATDFLIKSEWGLEPLVARVRARLESPVIAAPEETPEGEAAQ